MKNPNSQITQNILRKRTVGCRVLLGLVIYQKGTTPMSHPKQTNGGEQSTETGPCTYVHVRMSKCQCMSLYVNLCMSMYVYTGMYVYGCLIIFDIQLFILFFNGSKPNRYLNEKCTVPT